MHVSDIAHYIHTQARSCVRGFSLIELLVVLAIIAIITATILARYSAFNSTVLLKDLAYDVALAIREAQVLGVSVRGNAGTFTDSYGVRFAPGQTNFFQFRDSNPVPNGYQTTEEIISTYTIGRHHSVVDVCAHNGGATNCSYSSLHIVFKRPESDALFFVNNGSAITAESVTVVVGSGENTRAVRIYPTGQISIE